MNDKKQIEEMANDIAEAINHNSAVDIIRHGLICVNSEGVTRELYDDGYRKQSENTVEVVRCKDCKYWQDNNGGYPHEECRWGKDETPDADDFCSFGEMKGGAE